MGLGLVRVSSRVRVRIKVKVRVSVMVRVSIRTSWVVNFALFRCHLPVIYTRWRGGVTGKAFGLVISRSRVQILLEASCLHLCASVTKQYNLVPAKGR